MPTYYAPGTRKGNDAWIVRGYVNGEQYEIRAEKARNQKQAEAAWQDFASDTRREQRDADRDRETATFDWAVDEFIASRESLEPRYDRDLRALRTQFAGWPLHRLTGEDLKAAAIQMRPGQLPQTRNRHVMIPAGAVLHYMARRRLCDHIKVPLFDETDPSRPITRPDELEPLIDVATGELRAILLTFKIQGWRVSEVLKLRRDKIDWKRAVIFRWVLKSEEWREAAVDEDVLEAWKALPEHKDGRLFSYKVRHRVYEAVDALAKKHGMEIHYRPHQSRRGFATALRDAGYGLDDITDAGQWAPGSTTVRAYIKDNPDRVRPALAVLRGKGSREGTKKKSA